MEKAADNSSKTWYLSPPKSGERNYSGLCEGIVLQDQLSFTSEQNNTRESRVRITDLAGISMQLSHPFLYPVALDVNCRIEKADELNWYAEKVTLLKPFNAWGLFEQYPDVFPGSIDFSGLSWLPLGLKFPAVVKGGLKFFRNILPSIIKLPDRIEGEFIIECCDIPPTWKMPGEVNKITLWASSFGKNFHFASSEITEISIGGCTHDPEVLFPCEFIGSIDLVSEKLTSAFRLPETVGNLALYNVSFEKGAVMPAMITGTLLINNLKDFTHFVMPSTCKGFTAQKCKLPDHLLSRVVNLKEIVLEDCEISPDLFSRIIK
jgi:hypothetical protein